ncbi:MAG: hypothetical protein ACUVUP_02345 [Thermaceae bacterium]
MLRISLSLIAALALLAGCSAKTRYTIQVDVLSFIPKNNRGFDLPSGQLSATIPSDRSGQLVQWPSSGQVQNALERGRIVVEGRLKNTGSTDLTVDYEIRLAPEGDANLTDNQGDFVPEGGSKKLSLVSGREETLSLDITLSSDQNSRAFNLIKSGSFRILSQIKKYEGDGGRVDLEKAEVSLTVRPSALLE